jgi:hypothetical protein
LRCVDAGLDMCVECQVEEYRYCHLVWEREYIKPKSDSFIIRYYSGMINVSHNIYYIRNAIKTDRPHLIEKIDKLMVLI